MPANDALPREFYEPVLLGLRERAIGWKTDIPATGIRALIKASLVHPVDSRALSFRIVARLALGEALETAGRLRQGNDFKEVC